MDSSFDRPAPSPLFDWAMAVASLWLSGGIFVDAYYHFHNNVETFFEPAHALLYAGLVASFIFTGVALDRNRKRGFRLWRTALPQGYDATLLGLLVCLAGGVSDLIKHTLWGFEEGFNALLSPTHLLIGAGMFLIIAGAMQAAYQRRPQPRTLVEQLPMLLASASMVELIHWGMQFIWLSEAESANAPLVPTSSPHDVLTLLTLQYYKQGIGLLSVVIQSLLVAGFALYLKRRFTLAPGALTVFMVVANLFIALAHANAPGQWISVVVASAAAGAAGDFFRIGPERGTNLAWSAFAFTVPAVYWAVELAMLAITMGGIWWSPDVIPGSVLDAGLIGLFLNALCGPPKDSRAGLRD